MSISTGPAEDNMSLKSFKKVSLQDPNGNKLQDNLDDFFRPVINSPIIDGILLKNISLTNGVTNKIDHKLGRTLRGWKVVRQRASAIIWDTQDTNANPSTTLNLNCSAAVVVDLWVF